MLATPPVPGSMRAPTPAPTAPATPPLALAFLALADDGERPDQRSLPRMLTALVVALVLALGLPLAWGTASHTAKPTDQQPAALTSKSGVADDGDGG